MVKPGDDKVRLGSYLELLEDPQGKLTLEQVSSPPLSGKFRPNKYSQLTLGPTGSAWWLRFRTGPLGRDRLLQAAKANLDYVDLYFPTADGFETHLTGDMRPAEGRQIRARTFVFRLPKDYAAGQYVYLRLQSHTSLDLGLWIWSGAAWAENAVRELVIFGLLLGAILAMSVYNFFIFLSIRDRAYLYCVICMTFSALYQAQLFGVNAVLLDLPAGAGPLLIWSLLSISLTAGVAFSRTFLDTPRTVPRLDKVLLVFGLLSIMVGVLGVFGLYRAANFVSHTFNGLGPPFILVVGFIILRAGFTAARYFLLAWSFLLISIIVFVSGGILFPSTFFTFHALLPAAVLEVILFSFALTDRIKTLQQEQVKLIKQQRRLTEMSITDELTGLFNKR